MYVQYNPYIWEIQTGEKGKERIICSRLRTCLLSNISGAKTPRQDNRQAPSSQKRESVVLMGKSCKFLTWWWEEGGKREKEKREEKKTDGRWYFSLNCPKSWIVLKVKRLDVLEQTNHERFPSLIITLSHTPRVFIIRALSEGHTYQEKDSLKERQTANSLVRFALLKEFLLCWRSLLASLPFPPLSFTSRPKFIYFWCRKGKKGIPTHARV